MADNVELTPILRKLDQIINEQRLHRDETRAIKATVDRLDDTVRFNVLDRLQALEDQIAK
jgi:hypothetical protein